MTTRPAAALDHPGHDGACAEERAGRVHVEVPLPVGERRPRERRGLGDARVVDEDVDRTEPLEKFRHCVLVGHVADLVHLAGSAPDRRPPGRPRSARTPRRRSPCRRPLPRPSSTVDREDEVAVLVQARGLAGRDDERRDRRPDDRRARESRSRGAAARSRSPAPPGARPPCPPRPRRARRAPPRRPCSPSSSTWNSCLLTTPTAADAEADELDARLAVGGLRPVLLLVEPLEQVDRLLQRVRRVTVVADERGR